MSGERITITAAAELLGISRTSVYALLKKRRITHYRPENGEIQLYRVDLEAYRESRRFEAVNVVKSRKVTPAPRSTKAQLKLVDRGLVERAFRVAKRNQELRSAERTS